MKRIVSYSVVFLCLFFSVADSFGNVNSDENIIKEHLISAITTPSVLKHIDVIESLNGLESHHKDDSFFSCHIETTYLFEYFPKFKKTVPYVSLGTFPTPIKKLTKA
jgi:hypothetical protein